MTPSASRALMQQELDEQPIILGTAAGALSEAAARIRPSKDRALWVGGCGDSLFAAQSMTRFFRESGWDIRPVSASDMLWDADIRAGDTVVGISISGSTRRTVEAIEAAKAMGAHTLAITLKSDSALAQAAGDLLPLPYQPISRAIPHGLDYHVTLLALAALAGPVEGGAVQRVFDEATNHYLDHARTMAAHLPTDARFFFLGGGAALGSANYGAAKMHEAGGLAAWSFEAENFAHGAHFMLRAGDHVVLCGAGGAADDRTAAMRAGLERLGASVGTAGLDSEDTKPLPTALRAALATQALCLAVAEVRDLDVTDPARGSAAAEVQRDWFGWTSR
ncbi:SIS domain-containing protein [Tranquillimonas alkanivorans]|uniref:SIS domain-containing protein n=1 Tax=Tranquillimonas alkanivorans TaxID=441119 RepID=A0A1I5V8G5_9RHOB|nr:SIS domain-containing protein [Tranquillimonas alkanivorans]SFQ03789.1 SIS domain-containing protein [Tranquillimonas alkanivorans]